MVQLERKTRVLEHVSPKFFFLIFKICLFLASVDFHCGMRAFSVVESRGDSSLCCTGFLLRWLLSLQSYGAQASLLHSMWNLPGPEIKPVSPALAGGFLTTGLPGNFLLKRGVSYMCDADSILLQHGSVTSFRDPHSKAGDVTQKMENTGQDLWLIVLRFFSPHVIC